MYLPSLVRASRDKYEAWRIVGAQKSSPDVLLVIENTDANGLGTVGDTKIQKMDLYWSIYGWNNSLSGICFKINQSEKAQWVEKADDIVHVSVTVEAG